MPSTNWRFQDERLLGFFYCCNFSSGISPLKNLPVANSRN